jgi:hypothetical protein
MEITRGQFRAVRRMTNVPTVVLESSPGLLGLYEVWHCHDATSHLLSSGLEVFYGLHREYSTELYSMKQNSHFHHASANGLIVLPENPKTLQAQQSKFEFCFIISSNFLFILCCSLRVQQFGHWRDCNSICGLFTFSVAIKQKGMA